jgi:hypothetical protein
MCFSPEVSFASAAVLVPTGAYCVWLAAQRVPRLWPVAVVPAIFGVQQACEGFVWLGLHHDDVALRAVAGRAYLFFALAFWPFWFPAAAALMEPPGVRRRLLVAWALASSAWFWLACLPALSGSAGGECCVRFDSIRYDYADGYASDPLARWGLRVLYVATAAVPLLLSSWRGALFLPVVLAVISATVTVLLFDYAFTSVWCLFAAVLSVSLVHAIHSVVPRVPALRPAHA